MGNTFFYQEASKEDSKITWKDILSESFKKHTSADMEYALSAGTSLNSATEADMLRKWQKPWLGVRALIGGAAVSALLYAVILALTSLRPGVNFIALTYLCFIIPPCVSALAVMIFLWELNIPRNVSIYSMLGYFVLGGILSLAVTYLLRIIGIPHEGGLAPAVEEPAKLIVSAVFLVMWVRSGKRIYGLTGLLIGAGVGAGFTAFESISYAFAKASSVEAALLLAFRRSFPKIGGHILYCAPYVAGLALGYRAKGSWDKALACREFWIPFLCSCAGHFLWNTYSSNFIVQVLIAVGMWYEVLYMTRKCLAEAVRLGRYTPGTAQAAAHTGVLTVSCVNGPLSGRSWRFEGGALTIGRDAGCSIQLPAQSPGVSHRHCRLEQTPQGWMITDLASSYGTYLTTGRIDPGQPQPIAPGEMIYLGSKQFAFQVQIGQRPAM